MTRNVPTMRRPRSDRALDRKEGKPVATGDAPHLVHRVLGGGDHRHAGPQGGHEADREGHEGAAEGADVVLDLLTDDRELGKRGVEDPLLKLGVVLHGEAEDGHQHGRRGNREKKPW